MNDKEFLEHLPSLPATEQRTRLSEYFDKALQLQSEWFSEPFDLDEFISIQPYGITDTFRPLHHTTRGNS